MENLDVMLDPTSAFSSTPMMSTDQIYYMNRGFVHVHKELVSHWSEQDTGQCAMHGFRARLVRHGESHYDQIKHITYTYFCPG